MNFIVWNVRGLNDPLKQKDIVGRIRSLNVQMVCLLETRVKENKSQKLDILKGGSGSIIIGKLIMGGYGFFGRTI